MGQKDLLKEASADFVPRNQSARAKLSAGLNSAAGQAGNEFSRVEVGEGGNEFVAVGVVKRDRRSVEEIEAEMKQKREAAAAAAATGIPSV